MVDEVGAIVGGCVAGGFVFFAVLGIIIYLVVCKRKHRKRREQSKFRPITPQTSPTHSQPSTLGPDARLPKVNSTGLWVGAPSMYTGVAPSPAYYYGPGKVPTKQAPIHPGMITRASSDPRIPNSGLHYASYKPMYGSHGNLLISKHQHAPPPPPPPPPRRATSMPKVPLVGVQPRIYHSSQPLAPVFEVPPASSPTGLEIYDVYQFGGGNSRSKLVEERHTKHYYDEVVKPDSKLARSQSDVQEKSKKLQSRNSRSRDHSTSSSKQSAKGKVSRSSSSNSRDKVSHRPAPAPTRPSSSSVILQQHSRTNSKEFRMSTSAPGYRIGGMKSKSLDSLDDNISRSSFGGGSSYHNKAFEPGFGNGRVSSLSGDIILKPAPIPPKVAVVASASSVISSSTPRSDVILPNGVISGNVSKPKDRNSNNITASENEIGVDTSATDSMKLLAKNKTDDQKTVVAVEHSDTPLSSGVIPKLSSSTSGGNDANDVINDVIDVVEDKDLSKGHIHYIYQGDIYAVPGKQATTPSDDGENPIISRMKEMVVERTLTNSTKSMSSSRGRDSRDGEDLQSSTNNTPRSFTSDSIIVDTEYQEIGDVVKAMESNKDAYAGDNMNKNGISNSDVQLSTDNTVKENGTNVFVNGVNSEVHFSSSNNGILANGDIVAKNRSLADTGDAVDGGGGLSLPTSPVYLRQHSSGSKTADTTFDEINNAGKRITDSAFEFLNTYLSDDEGGDGQTSP